MILTFIRFHPALEKVQVKRPKIIFLYTGSGMREV